MKKIIIAVSLFFLSFSASSLTFVDGKQVDLKLDKINELEESILAISFELETYKSELNLYKTSNLELSDQISSLVDTKDGLSQKNTSLNDELLLLQIKYNELSNKNINLRKNNTDLTKNNNSLNTTNTDLNKKNTSSNTKLNDLNSQISQLKLQNKSLSSKNSELLAKPPTSNVNTSVDVEAIKSKLLKSEQHVDTLKKQISLFKSQQANQSTTISKLNDKIIKQSQLITKAADSKSLQLLNDIKSIENDLNIVKESNSNLVSSIATLKSLNVDSKNKLAQLKIINDATASENDRLSAKITSITSENDELIESQYLFSVVNYYLIFSTLFGLILGFIISFFIARINKQNRDSLYSIDRSY